MTRARRQVRWLAGVAVLLGLLLLFPSAPARATSPTPSSGEWFTYEYNTQLSGGYGNYSGYSESQTSTYTYTVNSVTGSTVQVTGSGSFNYQNNSGYSQAGSWRETFSFSDATRRYVAGFDVLGNYTSDAAVWFWAPPNLQVGQVVPILDENLTVTSLSNTVWLENFPPTPRVGILVEGGGFYDRHDVYGSFLATYTDQYWFDPNTGFIIAEYYTENDTDGVDGFIWNAQVFTTSASFPIQVDYGQLLAVYVGIPLIPIALFSYGWVHRNGPKRVRNPAAGSGRLTARRVRRMSRLNRLTWPSIPSFLPLGHSSARRAMALRDPVFVVTDASRTVKGTYVYDRIDKVGSMQVTDPAMIPTLLSLRKPSNVFLEVPNGVPNSLGPKGKQITSFDIFELSNVQPVPYDTALVRPMVAGDVPTVLALTASIYERPQGRQLLAAIADGDLAFVAVDGPMVWGYAMATVSGETALLYGLCMEERARGQGYATALTAARLSALAALGVKVVRMEVADGNAPPRHLAARFGFQKVGSLVYYNLRHTQEIDTTRRPTA